MKVFGSFSIRNKLLVSFAVVIALVVTAVAAGYFQLNQVKSSTKEVIPASLQVDYLRRLAVTMGSLESNLDHVTVLWGDTYKENAIQDLEEMSIMLESIKGNAGETDSLLLGEFEKVIDDLQTETNTLLKIEPATSSSREKNEQIILVYSHIASAKQMINELTGETLSQLHENVTHQENTLSSVISQFLILTITILALGIAISLLLSKLISEPIVELKNSTEEIALGNLDIKIKTRSKDEVGKLATALNTMVHRLKNEFAERQQAEQALRESEERFRTLVENVPVGVYRNTPGPKGRYLMVNPALLSMFGFDSEEAFKGTSVVDLYVNPSERKAFSDNLLAQGSVSGAELQLKKKDGSHLWGSVTVTTIYDERGKVAHFDGVIEDITERKRAEEALQESEEKYRTLFETARESILISGHDGRIETVNRAAATMLGFNQPEELVGLNAVDVFAEPQQREELFQELMEKGYVDDYELMFRKNDGQVIHVIGGATVHKDENGDLLRTEAIFIDITERKRAEEQFRRHIEELNTLHTIDTAITSTDDLKSILKTVIEKVVNQLDVDAADILVYKPESQTLHCEVGFGFSKDTSPDKVLGIRNGFAKRIAQDNQAIYVPDLTCIEVEGQIPSAWRDEGIVTYIGVPLEVKGQVQGVLELLHRSMLSPSVDWAIFLITLAGQIAIAIDNANLFDGLQQSNLELTLAYDTTLEGWAKALELRDNETEGHSRRVTELTTRLARAMGMKSEALTQIRRGAILHDIGKMGIPDSILHKPGPLSEGEWNIMRQHTVWAYNLLSPIPFLRAALDIPYSHHEKWDGTGYPRGLKGEQIPFPARIFAIVDVWDALLSDRPYRKGWSERKALEYIQEQSGKHFDPTVVEAFMGISR